MTNLQLAVTLVELKLLVSSPQIRESAKQYLPGCSDVSGLEGWCHEHTLSGVRSVLKAGARY